MAVAIPLVLAIVSTAVAILALCRVSKLSAALAERERSRQPEPEPAPPEPANDAKWAEFDALHRAQFERSLMGDDDVAGTPRTDPKPRRHGYTEIRWSDDADP